MSWFVLWLSIMQAGLAPADPVVAELAAARADSVRDVSFSYRDAGYEQVFLAGSFTDWVRIPLAATGDHWSITLAVPAVEQYYRFVVIDDGDTWDAIDPDNPSALNHAEYGWVSVLGREGLIAISDREEQLAAIEARKQHRRRIKRELRFGRPNAEGDSYQRVDGLSLGLDMSRVGTADTFEPSAWAGLGLGFSSGRLSAGLVLLQPLIPEASLALKVSLHDWTDYNDQTRVGALENSLAAFFLHEDYRDYYRNKGVATTIVIKPSGWLRLETGALSERHYRLTALSVWSVKKGAFISNPAADEGSLHSVVAGLQLGGSHSHVRLNYERSGSDLLGGAFTFEQVTVVARGRLKLGHETGFDVRLKAGRNYRGRLPVQRRYLLGGLGTVRGYSYQSLLVPASTPGTTDPHGGEKMVLGNLEYTIKIGGWLGVSLFYDVGMAWADRDAAVSARQLKSSAGLGFKPCSYDGFRIDMIQRLDDRDSKPVFQLRLGRAF